MVKNLPANAGDACLIPGLGRSSGERTGNPLLHSCLGNPMDRGAWQGPWGLKESDTTERLSTAQHGCSSEDGLESLRCCEAVAEIVSYLDMYIREKHTVALNEGSI